MSKGDFDEFADFFDDAPQSTTTAPVKIHANNDNIDPEAMDGRIPSLSQAELDSLDAMWDVSSCVAIAITHQIMCHTENALYRLRRERSQPFAGAGPLTT